MFNYSAICDVPVETLEFLTGLLHRHRTTHDRRPAQRAGTVGTQAKLMLQQFPRRYPRGGPGPGPWAVPGHGLPVYLHEGIKVLAAQAPDLHEALARAKTDELPYLTLDGTLIPTDFAGRTHRGRQSRLVLG
ncbi:hypothetical protein GCM10025781_09540 [Kocuria gwangalliensis]|uniref:Transposase n=1 Tax=Kocuria gwangalliensis TaxID=501592 RepID=A0ABP8WSB7_9MICC